ncbi:hypothetical protein FOZ60_013480, partial [Perkinsus olseni]
TVLDIVGGLGTIPIEAATNFTNARVLSGHRELPARPTAPGQGKQYPCSIDHARDWDAADEDSIDWIVTDMPFGNCRGPKKADMARVLHAVSVVLKPETGRCELLSKGYKRLDAAAA